MQSVAKVWEGRSETPLPPPPPTPFPSSPFSFLPKAGRIWEDSPFQKYKSPLPSTLLHIHVF